MGVREDMAKLKGLVPIAQTIIDAAEAADRILALTATTTTLETRKKSLALDVSDLLQKHEEHKQNGAALIAELEGKRAALQNEIEAQQQTIASEKQAWTDKVLKEAQDHEAVKAARVGILTNTVNAMKREIKDLTTQRDALKEDISATLAKYR